MSTTKKKVNFFNSEEAVLIEQELRDMAENSMYNTDSSYSANTTNYPDNLIPFVDKHMNYLNAHPKLDSRHYLANLRLITRKR